MPINFPDSPTLNQQFTANGRTWRWDGSTWVNVGTNIVVANITDLVASATEINYTDGVTSAIQTQLDSKAALSNPTFTAIGGEEGGQITLSKAPTLGNTNDSIIDVYQNVMRFGVDGFNSPIRFLRAASQVLDSQMRNITLSTSDPTGGVDGDVWLKYTP